MLLLGFPPVLYIYIAHYLLLCFSSSFCGRLVLRMNLFFIECKYMVICRVKSTSFSFFVFFFIYITRVVWVSLHTPRLIFKPTEHPANKRKISMHIKDRIQRKQIPPFLLKILFIIFLYVNSHCFFMQNWSWIFIFFKFLNPFSVSLDKYSHSFRLPCWIVI
jgi:hypothetical protein